MRLGIALGTFLIAVAAASGSARAEASSRDVICGLIDRAAEAHSLPPSFLTRLIWRESSFRTHVRSRAGAQGIAQFMPSTASERGLVDPFDPEAAIPASASYLRELRDQFGSLDLAAAAYNAGPGRIARWKAGEGGLPAETRDHVRFVTGTTLDKVADAASEGERFGAADCLTTLAAIRTENPKTAGEGLRQVIAPWGIQLIAGPSKSEALRDYESLQLRYRSVLGDLQPTILTTRLGGRGQRSYYRIRVAFEDRASASGLCRRLKQAGGQCLLVRN